jgi:hypothetical protein
LKDHKRVALKLRIICFALGISIFVLWGKTSAFAVLGEPESTVSDDRQRSQGDHTVRTLSGGIRMHIITTATGSYREFSGADGTIFAITWRGTKPSGLADLLGGYRQEFIQAIRTFRMGQSSNQRRGRILNMETDHLLITGTGHPRDLRGMVEIIGKTPPGFDPQNIPPQSP